jgi:hypothetical protein
MFIRSDEIRPDDQYYWVTENEDGSFTATPKQLEDREEVDQDGNPMYVKVWDATVGEYGVMVDSAERLVTRGLKSQHIARVKHNTNMALAQTDWYVIRKVERNVDIPAEVVTQRAAIIALSNEKETAIKAATTVEELKQIGVYI